MPFSKNDHMVQAVSPHKSDQPLHIGPRLGTGRSGEDFLNGQASDSLARLTPVDFVPIPQQETWSRVFGKGFNHLLPCPQSGWMLLHVEVKHTSAIMSQHYEDIAVALVLNSSLQTAGDLNILSLLCDIAGEDKSAKAFALPTC